MKMKPVGDVIQQTIRDRVGLIESNGERTFQLPPWLSSVNCLYGYYITELVDSLAGAREKK